MSYAGFCEKCQVPFYESDRLAHQHKAEPESFAESAGEPRKIEGRKSTMDLVSGPHNEGIFVPDPEDLDTAAPPVAGKMEEVVQNSVKKQMEWLKDSWRKRTSITLAEAEFALAELVRDMRPYLQVSQLQIVQCPLCETDIRIATPLSPVSGNGPEPPDSPPDGKMEKAIEALGTIVARCKRCREYARSVLKEIDSPDPPALPAPPSEANLPTEEK